MNEPVRVIFRVLCFNPQLLKKGIVMECDRCCKRPEHCFNPQLLKKGIVIRTGANTGAGTGTRFQSSTP